MCVLVTDAKTRSRQSCALFLQFPWTLDGSVDCPWRPDAVLACLAGVELRPSLFGSTATPCEPFETACAVSASVPCVGPTPVCDIRVPAEEPLKPLVTVSRKVRTWPLIVCAS